MTQGIRIEETEWSLWAEIAGNASGNMTSITAQNGTTTPFYIRPDNSLPVQTRDTYLLIATFVSVLIIMGIVIAFINRKCRNSLSRARFRLLHLRHHDALTTGRRRRQLRSTEVPAPHVHSLHDPNSPVYSKEVNVSVTPHPQHRPSRGERATGSWDSEHESGSCISYVDPDSGISVVSSKTGGSNCSMAGYRSTRDRTREIRETPAGVVLSPDNQLVKVLMPEKLIKDPRLITSSDVNRHVNSASELTKNRTRVRSFGPQHKITRMNVYSENTQGPRIIGSERLGEIDQHSSFDVISVDSSEMSFDENCNRVQCKNVNQTLHDDQYYYEFNSSQGPATQRNANQTDSGNIKTLKHNVSVPKRMSSTCYPPGDERSASCNSPHLSAVTLGVGGALYRQPETRAGLHGLIPSLEDFVDFLQERRRKLSFTNTEGQDDRFWYYCHWCTPTKNKVTNSEKWHYFIRVLKPVTMGVSI